MTATKPVALVTGASSGFGRAIANALVQHGYDVWGASRHPKAIDGARTLVMDITDEQSVGAGVAQVLAASGRIDVLVNNAGGGIAGAIEDTSPAEARWQFDTNFFGAHLLCRAVLPHMRKAGRGRIVNMSSLAGIVPLPFQAFYAASKFALEAYTEALRLEVRSFDIKVSMVEPGDFSTGFTASRRTVAACAPGSAYYETATRAVARMAEDESKNTDILPVVRAVLAALESDAPRLRYPVAVVAQRFLVSLRAVLPQRWFEAMILDYFKMR